MSEETHDPHTGYLTTGHVWNGIRELNTPVPRAIYLFLAATAAAALLCWVLLPAWPLGRSYTRGVLGADQHRAVARQLADAAAARAGWTGRILAEDFPTILADPKLMLRVRETGHRLFGDNCAACHGMDARGGPGFPNLTTNSWLWGGSPAAIAETIAVGINSSHPDSHVSQMPAFGRDQLLSRAEVEAVVAYVRGLSAPPGTAGDASGKAIFAANCAVCHGADAHGDSSRGVPNLADRYWIYGGDLQSVFTTVWGGRQGHMPSWQARLSRLQRRVLALYLVDRQQQASLRGVVP
jgi:cytochrome c oxidase cbb3-type subunit 3